MSSETLRLFRSRYGFLHGFGSAGGFGALISEFKYSGSDNDADEEALAADWREIGSDMREAIRSYEREQPN